LLEFRAVDTYYGDLHVLKAVNYTIEAGEIVCLLGGNASGKTTTMKTVMGRRRPHRPRHHRRPRARRHCRGAGSAPPVPAHDRL
jgi:ABC-type multidrug transport system ATPase subunit